MPFERVKSNYSDKSALANHIFAVLVSKIPKNKLWFGFSVRQVTRDSMYSFALRATSTSSALFLSLSKSVANLIHSVTELRNNIYLSTIHKKITDTWIDHVRNTYYDYYGDYGNIEDKNNPRYVASWEIDWEKETKEQYQKRIFEISQKLIKLFTPSGVTFLEVASSIKSFLSGKGIVEVYFEEPFKNVKKYPHGPSYVVEQLPGESNSDFLKRNQAYKLNFDRNLNQFAYNRFSSQINTMQPINESLDDLFSINSSENGLVYQETEDIKQKRLAALKTALGRYSLGFTRGKKYFNFEQYGATLNCTLFSSFQVSSIKSIEDSLAVLNSSVLKSVKAAGVLVNFSVYYMIGQTESTELYSSFSSTQTEVIHTGQSEIYLQSISQIVWV
jgi:hypothetical protein